MLGELAMADKKSTTGSIRMSLPLEIGRMATAGSEYRIPVENKLFLGSIDYVAGLLRRQS